MDHETTLKVFDCWQFFSGLKIKLFKHKLKINNETTYQMGWNMNMYRTTTNNVLTLFHPFHGIRQHYFFLYNFYSNLIIIASKCNSSSYRVIVWVRVVLKRTVVGDWRFNNLSGSHLQSQVNSAGQSLMFLSLASWKWLAMMVLAERHQTLVGLLLVKLVGFWSIYC